MLKLNLLGCICIYNNNKHLTILITPPSDETLNPASYEYLVLVVSDCTRSLSRIGRYRCWRTLNQFTCALHHFSCSKSTLMIICCCWCTPISSGCVLAFSQVDPCICYYIAGFDETASPTRLVSTAISRRPSQRSIECVFFSFTRSIIKTSILIYNILG